MLLSLVSSWLRLFVFAKPQFTVQVDRPTSSQTNLKEFLLTITLCFITIHTMWRETRCRLNVRIIKYPFTSLSDLFVIFYGHEDEGKHIK